MSDLTAQLADELDRALAGPVGALLGLDLADMVRERIGQQAPHLAADLTGDDDRAAAEVVIDIMCLLWPHSPPEAVDPEWWSTPLGQACARSLGRDEAHSVTRTVAAAMLGVHPGTIAQMVHRGTLDRHPDGGILRSSVLQRLLTRG